MFVPFSIHIFRKKLNIEHKILYYQNKFKKGVIDNFVNSYLKGETPIPCVQCNQTVKFRDLFKYAKDLNADALVTGHYVSRVQTNGHANMYRAKDQNRDQSYFLFSTTQEQLDFLRFPLGEIDKSETRKIAKRLNLNVATKPDSQDICFVPNGDYSFLADDDPLRDAEFSWFSSQVMQTPVRGIPEAKRSFLPSVDEKRAVGKMVHAIKMGWMKPTSKVKEDPDDPDKKTFYMLWKTDEQIEGSKTILFLAYYPMLLSVSNSDHYIFWET